MSKQLVQYTVLNDGNVFSSLSGTIVAQFTPITWNVFFTRTIKLIDLLEDGVIADCLPFAKKLSIPILVDLYNACQNSQDLLPINIKQILAKVVVVGD